MGLVTVILFPLQLEERWVRFITFADSGKIIKVQFQLSL